MQYRWKRKKYSSTQYVPYEHGMKGRLKEHCGKPVSESLQGHLNRGLLPQE